MWRHSQCRNEYLFLIAVCFLKKSPCGEESKYPTGGASSPASSKPFREKKISVISTCPIPQWEHSPLEQPQKFTTMVRVLCLTAINYPFATTDLLLTGTETRAPHINPFSLCKQAGELDLLLKLTFTSIHSS